MPAIADSAEKQLSSSSARSDEGLIVADLYRVVARKGSGTLGALFDATHITTDDDIVLEVLDASLVDRETVAEQFERTMRRVSRLRHRHILPMDGVGLTSDGDLYLAVRPPAAPRLSAVIDRHGAIEWGTARITLDSLLDALHLAHRRGIPHGGLRPDIIFVDPIAEPADLKVYEFGLHDIAVAARYASNTRGATTQLVGDPRYLALEQFVGGEASVAADIYALGAIAYHMLTGQPPFHSVNAFQAMVRKQQGVVIPPSRLERSIPPEVEAIVLQALAQDPNKRFDSIDALRGALTKAPRDVQVPPKPSHSAMDRPQAKPPADVLRPAPTVQAQHDSDQKWPTKPGLLVGDAAADPLPKQLDNDELGEATVMFKRHPRGESSGDDEKLHPVDSATARPMPTEILTGLSLSTIAAAPAPSHVNPSTVIASTEILPAMVGRLPSQVAPPRIREQPPAIVGAIETAAPQQAAVAQSQPLVTAGHVPPPTTLLATATPAPPLSWTALLAIAAVTILLGIAAGLGVTQLNCAATDQHSHDRPQPKQSR